MRTYFVKSGDNFRQIGKEQNREPSYLAALNGRCVEDELIEGEAILLPPPRECEAVARVKEGALCLNGFCAAGTSEQAVKEVLPYLTTLTEEGGYYTAKEGLQLPRASCSNLVCESGVTRLLLPQIGKAPLLPLGEYCTCLAEAGYGGLVLSISEYSTEELTSALPQLAKIYKNNNLALIALVRESALRKRPKLWIYLAEILDGIFLLADEITTPWEARLAHLGEDFPKGMRRRLYSELPYALACSQGRNVSYLPLDRLAEQIKKSHAIRGRGSIEWRQGGYQIYGEDAASVGMALGRIARLGIPGCTLHLGHTPPWILPLIRSRFACQVRCQRSDKHSPW